MTYRQQEANFPFLDHLLKNSEPDEAIFIISWGFDIPKLIAKLKHYHVIYQAHSTGYNFTVPSRIPIITVSRNTMGYWGQKSPNSLIYYLPNHISDEFYNRGEIRDIDVLVQVRKSSQYLLKQLVPELRQHCRLELLEGYVEDLAALFNRSKIYLYDSAEYWAVNHLTEGFGLPPLEALACGCQVFSSVNSALADYLDPGFNCYKIAQYSLQYDVKKILSVLHSNENYVSSESFLAPYRTENLLKRLQIIFTEINSFFDQQKFLQADIDDLTQTQLIKLWFQQRLSKLTTKLKSTV